MSDTVKRVLSKLNTLTTLQITHIFKSREFLNILVQFAGRLQQNLKHKLTRRANLKEYIYEENNVELKRGGKYNWKNQPERLIYLGFNHYLGDRRSWHQFAKVEQPDVVWCEVLESELHFFEETTS